MRMWYLSNFYKNALEENIKVCIVIQNNYTDLFKDISEQDIFSWDGSNMHFSLGLA